jgi:hypothetical protein
MPECSVCKVAIKKERISRGKVLCSLCYADDLEAIDIENDRGPAKASSHVETREAQTGGN